MDFYCKPNLDDNFAKKDEFILKKHLTVTAAPEKLSLRAKRSSLPEHAGDSFSRKKRLFAMTLAAGKQSASQRQVHSPKNSGYSCEKCYMRPLIMVQFSGSFLRRY
jgi:hypothetical protein